MPSNIAAPVFVLTGFMLLNFAFHRVEEGHVAVYYRGGALLPHTSDPGLHLLLPFITTYKTVQVTLQTDEVRDVPCGTSGGVMVTFDRIEVVNILNKNSVYDVVKNFTVDYDKPLIFDKVHHELNQFCSRHTLHEVYIDLFDQIDENLKSALQEELNILAPGLKIHGIRLTKPIIPPAILKSYELMEVEKTKLSIAIEQQKLIKAAMEAETKMVIIQAEQLTNVTAIELEHKLLAKMSQQELAHIEEQIYISTENAKAEVELYATKKNAEANELLLTPEYLELKHYEAIGNRTKVYYGPDIPSAVNFHYFANKDASCNNKN